MIQNGPQSPLQKKQAPLKVIEPLLPSPKACQFLSRKTIGLCDIAQYSNILKKYNFGHKGAYGIKRNKFKNFDFSL